MWNKLATWQLFLNLYRTGSFFTYILGRAIYKKCRLLVSTSFSNGFDLQEKKHEVKENSFRWVENSFYRNKVFPKLILLH